jgi:hypothetical protein
MIQVYIPRFFKSGISALPASFLLGIWIYRHRSFELNLTLRQKVLLLIFLMLGITLSTAAYYFTIAGPGDNADRIYNVVYSGFFLTMIIGWVLFFHSRTSAQLLRPIYTVIALLLFFTSSLIANDNVHLVWREWKNGQISAFDQQVKLRIETIREAAASANLCKIVYVKSYYQPPRSIWHNSDIAPNRQHYYWNRAYERYFGVDEVRLEGDSVKMLY